MALAVAPLAQTFFVDSATSPNGIFVAAVDLCFAAVDDQAPLHIQLRPTINGVPDINTVYHNGETLMSPAIIPVVSGEGTDLPTFEDSTKYARFTFPSPVYLPPGEHAIVFKTPSTKYLVYLAELQGTVLGSNRIVSPSPYVGSSYRSSNGGQFTAYQNQNIMFRIMRAKFTKSQAIVQFDNIKPSANMNMDVFNISTNDLNYGSATKIDYTFKSTDIYGTADTQSIPLQVKRDYLPSTRRIMKPTANGDFLIYTTMSTTDDQVSPVLDASRLNIIAVENLINNGRLDNSLFQITTAGTGLTPNTLSIIIDAPTGVGGVTANAYGIVTSNTLTQIILDNPGSGYITTPNVVINGANTTRPVAVIAGETSKTGGNSQVRYITRPVTLADGFDSTQLKVFLNAVRQQGTRVEVYYKVLSALDPDQNLNNKSWTRMINDASDSVISTNNNDWIEFTYSTPQGATVPPTGVTYTSNGVTFNSFRVFQFKICLFSDSTSVVPVVKSFRGIAIA